MFLGLFLSSGTYAASPFDTQQIKSKPELLKKEVVSTDFQVLQVKQVIPSILGLKAGLWSVECDHTLIGIKAPKYEKDLRQVYFSCFMPGAKGRIPIWTVHKLDQSYFSSASSTRPEFSQWIHFDEDLAGNGKTFTGMDRGHLVPRSDFGRHKETAVSTFTVLNRAPQSSDFNQNGWRLIETAFRGYARHKGYDFIVITGVTPGSKTTGNKGGKRENDTNIPDNFWKVLYDAKKKSAIYVVGGNEARKPGATGMAYLGISLPATVPDDVLKSKKINLGHQNNNSLEKDFYSWLLGKGAAKASVDDIVAAFKKVTKLDSPPICGGSAEVSFSLRVKTLFGEKHTTIPGMYLEEGKYTEKGGGCSRGCGITIKTNAATAIKFESYDEKKHGLAYDHFLTNYQDDLIWHLDNSKPGFSEACGDNDNSTWTQCMKIINENVLPREAHDKARITGENDIATLSFSCHYLK